MEQVLLIRYGEIHLKGLNRPFFERALLARIEEALAGMHASVQKQQGRIFVWGLEEADKERALDAMTRVFGVHSISPAVAVEKDWGSVCNAAFTLMAQRIQAQTRASFKVFARRSDKTFPMSSDTIAKELGHEMLERFPEKLHVDIHTPEIKVCVEIREEAFVYMDEVMGAGGMPTGTAGRAALLLSGGIDSPVAGYMLARRGVELSAVHFYSYPYTSVRARDKVVELSALLARYAGKIRLHLVPFTDIQMTIYE